MGNYQGFLNIPANKQTKYTICTTNIVHLFDFFDISFEKTLDFAQKMVYYNAILNTNEIYFIKIVHFHSFNNKNIKDIRNGSISDRNKDNDKQETV